MIRRGAYVDYNLGPRVGLSGSWSYLVPDILAYVDANIDASDDINRALAPSPGVAVLIKDTIVGQIYFVLDASELAIMD